MSRFRIGDVVRIAKKHHGDDWCGSKQDPIDMDGKITNIVDNGIVYLGVWVTWDNGQSEHYNNKHLKLVRRPKADPVHVDTETSDCFNYPEGWSNDVIRLRDRYKGEL